jgi:hypothetical protein
MTELRTIEIDLDVHKQIEMSRRDFSETPNDVLRRLIKLDKGKPPANVKPPSPPRFPWCGKGVALPHGTQLKMEYNGRQHTGQIDDGAWLVEGKKYSSPSAAASAVALTKNGGRTNLDGWMYWKIRRPIDNAWFPLRVLRKKTKPRTF